MKQGKFYCLTATKSNPNKNRKQFQKYSNLKSDRQPETSLAGLKFGLSSRKGRVGNTNPVT